MTTKHKGPENATVCCTKKSRTTWPWPGSSKKLSPRLGNLPVRDRPFDPCISGRLSRRGEYKLSPPTPSPICPVLGMIGGYPPDECLRVYPLGSGSARHVPGLLPARTRRISSHAHRITVSVPAPNFRNLSRVESKEPHKPVPVSQHRLFSICACIQPAADREWRIRIHATLLNQAKTHHR